MEPIYHHGPRVLLNIAGGPQKYRNSLYLKILPWFS